MRIILSIFAIFLLAILQFHAFHIWWDNLILGKLYATQSIIMTAIMGIAPWVLLMIVFVAIKQLVTFIKNS